MIDEVANAAFCLSKTASYESQDRQPGLMLERPITGRSVCL